MIKLDNQKKIKNFGKPYFIAEIGANHNGDMEKRFRIFKSSL